MAAHGDAFRESEPEGDQGMLAVVVTDPSMGAGTMKLTERPRPNAAALAGPTSWNYGDVVVEVRASGFTATELTWPSTWVDRRGLDRTPSIPGHEVAGVVRALGYGTTGLSVGQRVFGLTDWTRDGSLAEFAVVEARNLAPLPADVGFVTAAGVVMSGLTAWQGLFDHGHLRTGQTVVIHGAAGAVGAAAVQLAREAGAFVIGTGRGAHQPAALDFGVHEFVDLEASSLNEVGPVDLVLDLIGGEVQRESIPLIRPDGRLVTVTGPVATRPRDATAIDFVVVSDRTQLREIALRVREGRLRPHLGRVAPLHDAVAALNPAEKVAGKTVIEVR